MKNTLLYAFIVCFVVSSCSQKHKETVVKTPVVKKKNLAVLKVKPINLPYQEVYQDPKIKHLNMIGRVGKYGVGGDMGKILRVLRYKPIACAIESRYAWLHADTLLAMVAQEDGGADLLPNGRNDGGIGTAHMQGSLATDFGLHTFEDCDQLVCKKHGKKIRKLIETPGITRATLIEKDDRFNPILNLDAVGRMLTFYSLGKPVKDCDAFQTAICRYSGSHNYHVYYKDVIKYATLLHDPSYLRKVEERFNKMNPNLTINGEKADFKKYIEVCQRQNENYGLAAYKKLGVFTLQ